MNKAEIIETLATKTDTTRKLAGELLDAFLDEVMYQVATGEEVSLIGFGKFTSNHRPARIARNPRTGAEIEVPESVAPRFKPGATFKNAVNA